MGPKNLLILFFSTVAVSLVILIIFFSLFFKNVNLDFNTRLPESAPDIGGTFNQSSTMNPDSKADGLMRSTVNVPSDSREAGLNETGSGTQSPKQDNEPPLASDTALPPISDDALLENEYPQPLPDKPVNEPPPEKTLPSSERSTSDRGSGSSPRGFGSPARVAHPTPEARREVAAPNNPAPEQEPITEPESEPQAPPIP